MKECKICKNIKDLKYFRSRVKKSGEIYTKPTCHACYSKKNKDKYRELYNQKERERRANLSSERKEELIKYAREWKRKNVEKSREITKRSMRKKLQDPIRKEEFREKERISWNMKRKTLSDDYIVYLLITKYERGIIYKRNISPEIIETKRKSLILKRKVRNLCLQ